MEASEESGQNRRFPSHSLLSRCIGVTANRHGAWKREGLLDAEDLGLPHAIELAVLSRLIDRAGPSRGKRAWKAVRHELMGTEPLLHPEAWVVVDGVLERDALVLSTASLADRAALEDQVWVIPIHPLILRAKDAFDRHARVEAR